MASSKIEVLEVGQWEHTFGGSAWEVHTVGGRIYDVREIISQNYTWTYRAPRVGELVDDYLEECELHLIDDDWGFRTPYLIHELL